jgi:hypothetical protein
MTLYILVVKLCREVLVFYSRYLQSIFVGVGVGGRGWREGLVGGVGVGREERMRKGG